ncbi:ATP-binding cassette domain-containing protein [Sinorhizobium medicae]|uniref:ABC transporter ATP-binding protein n=1 Tax=Sinorhizobium medicae TaxID=110321 RepID=UPI0012957C25|nr:ATP-binding cassette domain-containing protein [Sinorhizobium medicae]MQV98454.1 ATP-binding cassette domain-containing protein [Sinorhizobium medicae]
MEPLLEFRDVSVRFSQHRKLSDLFRRTPLQEICAMDSVSLTVHRGEIHAIVGESGSGKSTLARVATRLQTPTEGQIFMNGEDVTTLRSQAAVRTYRKRVQMIFQDPFSSLNPSQTIFDHVAEPLIVNALGGGAKSISEKVLSTIASAGLRPAEIFARRYPDELSGGQRQRAVIAGALVMEPELVIADEPVSMLDVSVSAEILKLLLELRASRGLAYIFITHDLHLAAAMADRVTVMRKGRIIETGLPQQVLKSPAQDYTRQLLDSAPSLDEALRRRASRRSVINRVVSAS